MSSLACSGCGAPIALPADLTAEEIPCAFCPARTALPADLLSVRLGEHNQIVEEEQKEKAVALVGATVRKTTSLVMWIVIISTALPLIIGVVVTVVLAIVAHQSSTPPTPTPSPRSHTPHGH